MYSTRIMLALFVALALTAATAKHAGKRPTTEISPAANPNNESALPTHSNEHEFESPLRKPMDVYTLPLSERVTLTPLGMRRLDQVYDECSTNEDKDNESVGSEAIYKPLGYIKYSDEPEKVLKYFLVKVTWMDAQAACAGDDAALYTFDHPVQLDSAMANFYPLLTPWVDLQKARVDGGSMLCGFLHSQASGKSSLRWDDCNAKHHFICQKSAATSTTPSPQYRRENPNISSRTTYVTLPEFLNAFINQNQFLYNLAQPVINLGLLSPFFSFAQKAEITSTNGQWHNLAFVVLPGINEIIANNPVLSPAQMQQIKTGISESLSTNNQMETLLSAYASQLPTFFAPLLPIFHSNGNSVAIYNVLADIFSNTLVQPTISATQAQTLNDALAGQKSIHDAALGIINALTGQSTTTVATTTSGSSTPSTTSGSSTPTTTTDSNTPSTTTTSSTPSTTTGSPTSTTTTVSATQPLAQVFQSYVTATVDLYIYLLPILNVPNPSAVTASEAAQIQSFLSRNTNLVTMVFPSVVTMLSTNPTLRSAQIQQLKDAIDQGIIIFTNGQCLKSEIASYFSFSPAQMQALLNKDNKSLAMLIGLLEVVNLSNNLPAISAAQLLQLQNLLGSYQSAITAVQNTFPTSTTTTTSPATTTHVLTQAQRNTVVGQISGLMGQIAALLLQLFAPAVTSRTTAAQLEQPEAVINKLLTLRSRQAEIETIVRTLSAHEQKTIISKLDASRDRLSEMMSSADRSDAEAAFTQYLEFLPGKKQLLTQLLEQIVDILQPFF